MRPTSLLATAALLVAPALLAPASAVSAQAPAPPPSATAGAPPARPEDVANPRRLVAAVYATISGPAGPRDWARFRSLFLPGARMTVARVRPDGSVVVRTLSLDDYQANSGKLMMGRGFFEKGVRDHVDQWAHTATVRSLYESRSAPADARPFARGINTFQLVGDGARWWIAALSWEAETPSTPIPADALLDQPPQA